MEISMLVAAAGILTALTNIITEVVKQTTKRLLPTNILSLIVSELLTVSTGAAYCQMNSIPFRWYIGAALIAGGFLVAYAAMFGFDKLQEALKWRDSDGE